MRAPANERVHPSINIDDAANRSRKRHASLNSMRHKHVEDFESQLLVNI